MPGSLAPTMEGDCQLVAPKGEFTGRSTGLSYRGAGATRAGFEPATSHCVLLYRLSYGLE